MNPDNTALNLRDIHLPSSMSWWPPAPGWWLLLGITLLILALSTFLYRRQQRRRMHRAALNELTHIKTTYEQNTDEQQLVKALSIWLRRVCLSFYPRVDVAGLTGQAWLVFLDDCFLKSKQEMRFSDNAGQVLISAPYQPDAKINADELLSLCQSWLKTLPRSTHHPQVQP